MGQVTLYLPQTLQKELEEKAKDEGIVLAQYIVYALTRQINNGYFVHVASPAEVGQQRQQFEALLEAWGDAASDEEVDAFLAARELAEPEPELTLELVAKVQARIAAAHNQTEMSVKESA